MTDRDMARQERQGTTSLSNTLQKRGLYPQIRSFTTNRLNLLGAGIVILLIILAVFAPVIAPYDPLEQHLMQRLEPPSAAHPFGTDQLGRDVLSRILYGARISLGIAIAVTAIRLFVGMVVGLVAGYVGGWVDEALMRLVDVLLAFPGIVFALVIAGILGPNLVNMMVALALVGWSSYARLVRGSVLSMKERQFVTASRLLGASHLDVSVRHIVPNIVSPVIVLATLDLGSVILGIAGLSFLGLGAQPPTPEWGTMMASGRNYLRSAWWLITFPGMAIMLTVLGFNLLGDGLRDTLDQKQETRIDQL